jgi:hypothetical protein
MSIRDQNQADPDHRPTRRRPTALGVALLLAVLALGVGACGNDEPATASGPNAVTSTTAEPGDAGGGLPDFPNNDDPSAVVCTGSPRGVFDAAATVGEKLADAERAAQQQGCEIRVVVEDGEQLAVTDDFRPDRVNVAVEGGTVTEIVSIG